MLTSMILVMAITFGIGIFLIAWPGVVLILLCRIIGAAIAIAGIAFLIQCIVRMREAWKWVVSILAIAVGIYILTAPVWLIDLLPIIIGIYIIVNGIYDIIHAIGLSKSHYSGWWVALIFAIVTLGCGVLLVLKPFQAASTLVVVIGIVLIFNSLSEIWTVSRRYKYDARFKDNMGRRKPEKPPMDAEYHEVHK